MTITDKARELASQFQRKEREDETTFWCIKIDAPDRDLLITMTSANDVSRDYAYQMTREVLDAIADTLDDDETLDNLDSYEIADGLVDVYTSDLIAFIADGNSEYADDAMEGNGSFDDFDKLLTYAQYLAYQDVLSGIVANWPEDITPECSECGDEIEDDDEEGTGLCGYCRGHVDDDDDPDEN